MPEIHINNNDIETIVKSYKNENDSFVIKSFYEKENQKVCLCFIDSMECKIVFYLKKKKGTVKIVSIGKNPEKSKLLIDFIVKKGFNTKVPVKQFSFHCTPKILSSLIKYINEDCIGIVSYRENSNIYRFTGYNEDILTFTFYSQSNKALIQGKPFYVFNIIVSFLAGLSEYSFDQIVEMNNAFINMNTPSESIRNDMKNELGPAYHYLDEALLKCISGSLTLLKQKIYSEDYTGFITGDFRALEGYLMKLLTQKFNYKLRKRNTFSIFHKPNGNPSQLDLDLNINNKSKKCLIILYNIYRNKRNVYLHSTIDPSQTRIISTFKEANDLSNYILTEIKNTYSIIFE